MRRGESWNPKVWEDGLHVGLNSIGLGTPVAAGTGTAAAAAAAASTATATATTAAMEVNKEAVPFTCSMFVTFDDKYGLCLSWLYWQKGQKVLHPNEKTEAGKLSMCGVNSHTKKAVVKQFHYYHYTKSAKHKGYTKHVLDTNYNLASCVLKCGVKL
jgi:hypothetical protein